MITPHAIPRPKRVPRRYQRLAAMVLLLVGARLLVEVSLASGPLSFIPRAAAEPSEARVASVVRQHAAQWQPLADPLVTVAEGVQVKSSNVYGIEVDRVRYYYHFTNTFSYDPIARGEAGNYSLVTVIEPGSPFEVEVYRLD